MPQDKAKAIEWYTKAAEAGNGKAQFNLAVMYDDGEGVPEDKAQAVKWYTAAAESGLFSAQYNLAIMHKNGEGTDKDLAKAYYWACRAVLASRDDGEKNGKAEELKKDLAKDLDAEKASEQEEQAAADHDKAQEK